jgi:hypothetical protein
MSTTATTLRTAKAAGTFVHIDPTEPRCARWAGTNWTVDKVNPSTVSLVEEGTGRRLKAAHEFVIDGPVPQGSTPGVVEVPLEEFVDNGSVVRFTNKGQTGLYVVTGQTAKGYRLFALGGSASYFTGVPARRFEVLGAEQIAAMKAAL